MKKYFGALVGAATALLAVGTTQAPTEAPAQAAESRAGGRVFRGLTNWDTHATSQPPVAPAKQPARPGTPRQPAYRSLARGGYEPRFVERPLRRRVKYGRHRWVVLG